MDRCASQPAHGPARLRPSAPPRSTAVYASARGTRGPVPPRASGPRPSTPRPPSKRRARRTRPALTGPTVRVKDSVPYRQHNITPEGGSSPRACYLPGYERRRDGSRVVCRVCANAERQRLGLSHREPRPGMFASSSQLRRTRGSLTLHTIDAERLRTFAKSSD